MNETSFRQGVRHLRLVLLMAIVGIMIASPLSVVMAQPPVQNTAVAPVVTLSATTPDQVFLGTSFEFTATFENEGTVTGYEPFIDLLIPAGVTVSASDITYLGTPVTSLGGEVYITNFGPSGVSCDTSSAIEHPAGIRQATGVGNVPISSLEPYYLCGPANTSVVTVVLPFGSFVPGQTAEIDVQATLSTSAGLDDLTIRSRAGFRRGETPADDPCCDPVIFEGHETSVTPIWKDTTIVDPTLVRVNKTITNAPGAGEDELVTGPNNPATYEIELTIAPGQTITNLNVLDMLPHNIIVTGITATGGTINPSITYPFSPDASDGDFNVLYANASGTYTIEVDFYIPIYENGTTTNVLNPAGSVEDIDNNLLVTGTWNGTTFDINDPLYVCDTTCDATYRFQAKPIAIQKSNDFNDIKVGDILTYTLDFQVSDYYGFRNIVITDTLGDGLQYVGNATLSIRGGSASTINPSNTPLPVVNGVTTIQYEIPGDLLGGCYPVDSSTDNQTVCTNGRAYGQIQFQARVLPEYSGGGWSGDPAIDQGDSVVNTVQISGDILNPVNDTPYGSAQDGSGVTNPVPYGQLSKAIVAVDRVATSNASEIEPGELVTYELAYTLPTTSFEPINVVDYLPLPAFEAVALTLNNAHAYPASTFPDEFEWSWSITPTGVGTFHGLSTTPTVSANAGSNALTFVFPAYTPPTAQNPKNFPSTLRIRFTLPVEYHDSADGMLLTNQAMVSEGSTGDNQNASSNIVQVDLRRPVLTVKKEMTGSENGLASLDAGDVVNFRLEIANVGGRAAYDVLIKDTIVYGFDPSSITNLEIRDGSGTLITSGYTRADGSPATPADLFANGIMLVDPNGGICHPATDPNNPTGNSMIVITYDLTVREDVEPGSLVSNEVEVEYSNEDDGDPFDDKPTDDAENEIIRPITLAKGVVGTSEAHTGYTSSAVLDPTYHLHNIPPNNTASTAEVTNGEIVRYRIVTEMPAGRYTDAHIRDTLPNGVTYKDDGTARYAWVVNAGDQFTNPGSSLLMSNTGCSYTTTFPTSTDLLATTCTPTSVRTDGNARLFDISRASVANDDFTIVTNTQVYLVIDFNVVVNATATGTLNNVATAVVGTEQSDPANVRVNVVRPTLTLDKTITHVNGTPVTGDPINAEAGDTVTYVIVIRNNANLTTEASRIAYDVNLSDLLPADVAKYTFDDGSLGASAGTGLPGTYVAPTTGPTRNGAGTQIDATWLELGPGQYSRITYEIELEYSVEPTELLTNTAEVEWDTLEGPNGTTPNETGSTPGPSWEGDDEDTANVRVYNIVPEKWILATSADHTRGEIPTDAGPYTIVDATIGEIVRYELRASIPRGTSNSFTITDLLPAGFDFINDPQVLVGFSHTTINSTTIGNPTSLTPIYDGNGDLLPAFATFVTVAPPDANGRQNVTFNFGNVNNATLTGDGNPEEVVIQFNVLVNNAVDSADAQLNVDGQNKVNRFTVSFDRGGSTETTDSNDVTVNIVEPEVSVTKRITAVNGTSQTPATSVADLQAGDEVQFTLTITNTGAITAYDINLVDLLPEHLTIIGTVTGATAGTNSTTSLPEVTHYLASLDAGASHTVTYTVRLDTTIPPEEDFINTASIVWTSLEGDQGDDPTNPTGSQTPGDSGDPDGERTGDDTTNPANTYRDEDSATISTTTFTVAKAVHATGDSNTLGTNVAIGETITYRLTTTIPRGTAENVVITDTLPATLEPISATIVSISPDVTNTGGLSAGSTATVAQAFTFNFGTVVNNATGTGSETIVIDVVARVRDVPSLVAGSIVNNTYTLSADGVVDKTTPNVPVTVVEPNVTFSKAITAINGAPATGDQTVSAGDVVTYTITVTNTSTTAAAYNVVVSEVGAFPAWLDYQGLQSPSDWTESPSGTFVYGDGTGNNLVLAANGGTSSFEIEAEVLTTAKIGDDFINTIALDYESSPEDGRSYDPTDEEAEEITVDDGFELYKAIITTDEVHTGSPEPAPSIDPLADGVNDSSARPLTVGEVVTFRLVTQLPALTVDNVVISDTFVDGLEYVADSVRMGYIGDVSNTALTNLGLSPITVGANLNDTLTAGLTAIDDSNLIGVMALTGADIHFTFGTVANNDPDTPAYIVIEFDAVVVNTGDNPINGRRIWSNQYSIEYVDGGSQSQDEDSNIVYIRVVEPQLQIAKTASPTTGVKNGDTITYTLTVSHASTSEADAFDVSVVDVLPADVTFVAGSVEIDGASSADPSISGQTLTFSGLGNLPLAPAGETIVIEFDVTVDSTITPGQSVINGATVRWQSTPDDKPHTRDGSNVENDGTQSDPNDHDNYADRDEVTVTASVYNGTPVKQILSTSQSLGGDGSSADPAQVAIGEIIEYRLMIPVFNGTVASLTIEDQLTTGIQYIYNTAGGFISGLDITISDPATITYTGSPVVSYVGNLLEIEFTNVVNTGSSGYIQIDFEVLVVNPTVSMANIWSNTFTVSDGTTNVPSNSVDHELVEPNIVVTKTADVTTVGAGDTFTYTLEITNTGNAPAHNVVVVDVLPNKLTYIAPATAPTGYIVAQDSINPQQLTFSLSDALSHVAGSNSFTLTFDVSVDADVVAGETITNTIPDSNVTFTTHPTDGGDPRTGTGDDEDVTVDDAFTLEKIIFNSSYSATATTPSHAELTIGEVITYRLVTTIPAATLSDVRFEDVLIRGLQYVDGSARFAVIEDTNKVTLPAAFAGVSRVNNIGAISDVSSLVSSAYPAGLINVSPATYDPASATTVVFNVGDVVNNGPDTATLVVEFDAIVANDLNNTQGRGADQDISPFDNVYDIYYDTTEHETSNRVTMEIVEPELEITKTVTTNPTAINNGSTVTYSISVANTGTSPAHNVVITDNLESSLTYLGNITGANPTFNQTGQLLTFGFDEIAVGGTVTFTFDVQITGAVQPGTAVNNTATTTWTSLPDTDPNERTGGGDPNDPNDPDTYTDNSTVPFTVRELSDIEKSIGGHGSSTTPVPVTIGDIVEYQLAFLVDKGTTATIVVDDILVNGIEIVPDPVTGDLVSVTTTSADITGHTSYTEVFDSVTRTLTVTFNNVNNASTDATTREHLVVTFNVVVTNSTINSTGAILPNEFTVTTPSGTSDPSNTVNLEIVEPKLNITKTALGADPISGSTLTYSINVEHISGSTDPNDDSAVPAYDLVITDVLPTEVDFVADSVTSISGHTFTVDDSALPTLTITLDELPLGEVAELTFDVEVTALLTTGDTFTNDADVTWTTQPDTDPNERTGDGDPNDPNDPNTYRDEDDHESTIGVPTLPEKRIAGSADPTPVGVIRGQRVAYQLAVRLDKGLTNQLVLTDTFVPGIEYDPSTLVITTEGNDPVTIGNSTPQYDPATRTLTVTLEDVNNPSTATTWTEYVVVEFEVVLIDDESINNTGQIWANTFDLSVDSNPPITSNPVSIEVLPYLPDLTLTKSHAEARFIADNPDPYIYTIVVENIGGRAIDNAPIIVRDSIPAPYLEAVDASGTDWACTVTGNDVECNYTGSFPVAVGALPAIEISVLAKEQGIFDNIAVVDAPNTTEITTDNNEDSDNTIVRQPGIFDPPFGVKTVDASGLPVLEWGMVWINPETLIDGVAYRARVVDPLPAGTTYVAGSLTCYFADLSTTNFSTTDRCDYDAANNAVIWEGSLGASGGDTNVDTAPNRLYIVFATTLQDGVEYAENVATATYDSDGDDSLGNDEGTSIIVVSAEHGDRPAPSAYDPAIVKLVNPIFAQRGEAVTWTITVSNPHNVALDHVSFVDNMPAQFAITGTHATAGDVTVNGQVIRFTIAQLDAGQTVTVQVTTQLADNAEVPFVVDNTALLDGSYHGQSTATVTGIAELPATGETPHILDTAIFRFIRDWHSFISTLEFAK